MALNQNDLVKITAIIDTALKPVKKYLDELKETTKFTKNAVINILDWTQDIHESIFLKKIPERVKKLEEAVFPKN